MERKIVAHASDKRMQLRNFPITRLHLFYAKYSSSVASIFPIICAIVMQFVLFYWMFHGYNWIINATLDQPLSNPNNISHSLHFSSVFPAPENCQLYTHSFVVSFFFRFVDSLFIISVNHSILRTENVRSQFNCGQHSFILWSLTCQKCFYGGFFKFLYLSIWRLLR